jgi:hypothetical protein
MYIISRVIQRCNNRIESFVHYYYLFLSTKINKIAINNIYNNQIRRFVYPYMQYNDHQNKFYSIEQIDYSEVTRIKL